MSHAWKSSGEKRTIWWYYEPPDQILTYLEDMRDAVRIGVLEGLRTAERPGRPGSIDGRTEEEIRTELSGSDHWSTSEISRIVREKSGVTYTRRHLY